MCNNKTVSSHNSFAKKSVKMNNSDGIWIVKMHMCVLLLFICVQVGIGSRVILVENAPSMYISPILQTIFFV